MKTPAVSPKTNKIDGIDKWEVEDAARAITRAQEIANKPKLLKAAMKVLNQQLAAQKKAITWADNL